MGAGEQRKKSQEQAAFMKEHGIYHGKRITTPMHANYPKTNEVGSTKAQRLRAKQREGNQSK